MKMKARCDYSQLNIPNDPSFASVVGTYAGAVARKMGMKEDDVLDVTQALQDVIVALIDYSFQVGEQEELQISCERVVEGLRVGIRDKGTLYFPPDTSTSGSSSQTQSEKEFGDKLFELRKRMDEVIVQNLGPDGKETVLIKYLTNTALRDYYIACETRSETDLHIIQTLPPGSVKVTVRAMRPSEAQEVTKCIYETYGYSYMHDYLYYPERIIELNENGQIHTAVGVTDDGEIAGLAALSYQVDSPSIAEMAQAMVKPKFRGQGVLKELSDYLVNIARTQGLLGVMARAVTLHTYSQRVIHRLSLVPVGILLGYFPKTHQYRGISENLENRVTAELVFMYLDSPTEVQIYPPEHHRQMILQLYGNMRMKPQMKVPSDEELAACETYSAMRISFTGESGILRIDVSRCGTNVHKEIQATLKEFRLKGVDLIHVYLNLFDPITCMLTKQLEDFGFFFAGILPGGIAEGDALILQYLNNVPIQYDKIHLELDQAKTILSYVNARNPN